MLWFTAVNVFLFCFIVLSCECIFLFVLCCVMFIDMLHIQMQLMQRLDQWNKYICMYVYMYVCMYVCMCVCICMYVCMYVCVCICV